MQYLIYILAFIPLVICGPLTAPQGVISYSCPSLQGKPINVLIADTRASLQSSCSIIKSGGKKITEFPKAFQPAFGQRLSATSATGKLYISPVNKIKFPNVYLVARDGCQLAAVMIAGPGGLRGSQTAAAPRVVSRPGKSVRTRPVSSVPLSVRTVRPIAARAVSNTGEIEKIPIKGSDLRLCSPKSYSWDNDISGTGRPL